jgi:hypothetical protein
VDFTFQRHGNAKAGGIRRGRGAARARLRRPQPGGLVVARWPQLRARAQLVVVVVVAAAARDEQPRQPTAAARPARLAMGGGVIQTPFSVYSIREFSYAMY